MTELNLKLTADGERILDLVEELQSLVDKDRIIEPIDFSSYECLEDDEIESITKKLESGEMELTADIAVRLLYTMGAFIQEKKDHKSDYDDLYDENRALRDRVSALEVELASKS